MQQEYNPEDDEQADNVETMRVSATSKAPVNKMVKESKASRQAKALDEASKPAKP